MRRGFCGFLLLVGLAGCRPSRESMSAGQIGCPPEEINVSQEQSSSGFLQSSATWYAECRGKMFICSELAATSGPSAGTFNVDCRPEVSDKPVVASGEGSGETSTETAKKPGGAPIGGGGFEFGTSGEAAQKACEAAGNSWSLTGTLGTCSGAAQSLGFDASVTIEFQRERASKITVVHAPEKKWASALAELRTKLAEKYGAPYDSAANVPPNCRTDAELVACFDKGLRLRFTWTWKSGERLELSAGKPAKSEGDTAIRVEYEKPAPTLGADASAL
jgi:hypothetical protein